MWKHTKLLTPHLVLSWEVTLVNPLDPLIHLLFHLLDVHSLSHSDIILLSRALHWLLCDGQDPFPLDFKSDGIADWTSS